MAKTKRNQQVREAIALLAEEARRLIREHPLGHLLERTEESLDIRLSLPTDGEDTSLSRLSNEARDELRDGVDALVRHHAAFRPGRIYCLRCGSPDCEHAEPSDCRQVFSGFGSTGIPRFLDFSQRLLELQDRRVGKLYANPPRLVALVQKEEELTRDLLPAFLDQAGAYRVHGQVCAGWYRVKDPRGGEETLAVTFQIISSRVRKQQWRLGLNVVGLAPSGEPLETLMDRMGEIPWSGAARWTQDALRQIEHGLNRRRRRSAPQVRSRLDGVLNGLARRLERGERVAKRLTRHAETRRRQQRPTDKALADLAVARDDQVLFDGWRKTLVVLGERGRAHVFNRSGKLVTSVRYSTASIARRRQREHWREARAEEIAELRRRVRETAHPPDEDDSAQEASGP